MLVPQKTNNRDILILISLFVLLIALVIIGDYRSRMAQTEIGEGGAVVVAGEGNPEEGKEVETAESAARWRNAVAFFKTISVLMVVILVFLTILIIMIILMIRVARQRSAPPKSPPAPPPDQTV